MLFRKQYTKLKNKNPRGKPSRLRSTFSHLESEVFVRNLIQNNAPRGGELNPKGLNLPQGDEDGII